jgi:WD40 repeat protein
MLILRNFLLIGPALSLMLTACSPAAPAFLPATPFPTTSSQPTLPPATITFAPKPAGVGVPAIRYLRDKSELVVISPVTGQELDSFTPLSLRDFYNYAFAPDGRTLALVANARLYLIDLPSWKTREYDLGVHGWMSSFVYSKDGSLLALASGDPESHIWIVDTQNGKITAKQKANFSIRKIQFTADGKALMAYGPHIASDGDAANAGVSVGSPKATLYSLSDLNLLWSTELDGVRDGTFPKKADAPITNDIYLPGAAWHYEPGIAFSPNSDTLYLVHGDEEKLTTVDFVNQKVHTVDVQVKTSWLDHLMSFTAGVAHAKGMDGTVKQAFISPDGKLLFVGGNTEAVIPQTDKSDLEITDTPIGLQVIIAEDGTLVTDLDIEATPTGLSSDNRYIFLTGWKNNDRGGIPTTDVYETSSMSLIKHIDHVQLMPTRRIDGKPILVSSEYIGTNGDDVCFLASVDSDTWTITNSWNGSCVGWLIVP